MARGALGTGGTRGIGAARSVVLKDGGLKGSANYCRNDGAAQEINVVCPGYIDTEMVRAVPPKVLEGIIATIPVGRLGKGEEIAKMCAFLASDDAAFITGATMTVNGAQYIAG